VVAQQTLVAADTPYQNGFKNSLRVTASTSIPSYLDLEQSIEGYNTADLNWGTSFGSPVTISFWFRSQCTSGSIGSIAVRNSAANYSYTYAFPVTAPATWQYVTFTVPPPPNGTTWLYTTGVGIILSFCSYLTTNQCTAGSWQSGNFIMATGATALLSTAGNYIEFTGVQLEKGTVATPFDARPYATELALCQRYYQVFGPGNTTGYNRFGAGHAPDTTHGLVIIPFQVSMRAAPTTFSNSAPNTFQLNSGAAAPVGTAISTSDMSPTSAQLYVTVASGLTAGYGVICIGNGTTAAYVGFGAEL